MEKIIEKMDSYNILNYLLPGAIFDYMFEILFHMKLVQYSWKFIRILFLGMICKKIKWVKFEDYGDFIKAS